MKLLLMIPIKYDKKLFDKIVKDFNKVGPKSMDLVLLVNGVTYDKFLDIRNKISSKPNIHVFYTKYETVYKLRYECIEYFLTNSFSDYLMMLDPDDLIDFKMIDDISKSLGGDIIKLGSPCNKKFTKKNAPLVRNFSIYHLWNTIFSRRIIKGNFSYFQAALQYNIRHSEDFVINRICERKSKNPCFKTMVLRSESPIIPVYENNKYSNFSVNTDIEYLIKNTQEVFRFFDDHKIFDDQYQRAFQYSKIIMECGMHCYKRIINASKSKHAIFKPDMRDIGYGNVL